MKILTADYILPISGEAISGGAVAFEKDKIIAVGKIEKLKKEFPEASVENFGEAAIMPGLINAHSHLELTLMRGFLDYLEDDFSAWLLTLAKTRHEKLTAADLEFSALWGAIEGARAGVTCFADIGRVGRAGFEALKKTGLRGVVFQETEFSPKNETATEDFARLKEKFLALKTDETALVKIGISPHSPYTVSRKLFEEIANFASDENVKISVHAAESGDEITFLKNGAGFFARMYEKFGLNWDAPRLSPIEYLAETGILKTKPLLAHCVKTTEKDFELIAETNSGVAHCPKSNAKLGHGIAPLEKFLENNLPVGFGSDSVASNNTCDIFEEARFAALMARARDDKNYLVTAEKILETATLGAARAVRLESEIGSLEAGKQADLIVVSLNHPAQQPVHDVYSALVFASNARDVRLTIVAGEEIYRGGRLQKIDERETQSRIMEIARKMNDNV
ncbi:MAG: amidohydrolase family protein [Pyrinomonadaceae bacterium]